MTGMTQQAKKLVHYVIDLETTGVVPGCGILAIGVAPVDSTSHFQFYGEASLASNTKAGLHLNTDTMAWWEKQSLSLFESFLDPNQDTVDELIGRFAKWLQAVSNVAAANEQELRLWGNGAVFDWSILEHAADKLSIHIPIDPRQVRCYRTLKESFSHIPYPTFVGTPHYALDDAINEATHLKLILKETESCRK